MSLAAPAAEVVEPRVAVLLSWSGRATPDKTLVHHEVMVLEMPSAWSAFIIIDRTRAAVVTVVVPGSEWLTSILSIALLLLVPAVHLLVLVLVLVLAPIYRLPLVLSGSWTALVVVLRWSLDITLVRSLAVESV